MMKLVYLALMSCILTTQGHKLHQKSSTVNKVHDSFQSMAQKPGGAKKSGGTTSVKKSTTTSTHRQLRPGGGSSGSRSSGKNDSPFATFIVGCFLIGFALPMVWMNERKQVKIFKLIARARKLAVPYAPSGEVISNDNFKLIHTSAETTTQKPIEDERFSVSVPDSMKIKRVVEMYQWVETVNEGDDNNETTYSYSQQWSSSQIDSSGYNSSWYTNPPMPIQGEEFETDVNLGQYLLAKSQVDQLSPDSEYKPSQDEQSATIQSTSDFWSGKGFEPLHYDGTYYTTRLQDQKSTANGLQTGDTRVKWCFIPNQQITVVAQQMQNDEGVFTFRQWNPDKQDVNFGENNDSNTDATCPIQCCCCWVVEKLFKTLAMEVMNYCRSGQQSVDGAMDNLDADNKSQTTIFRWVSWIMSVVGHYFLFAPFIALFAWIPLVGGLLSGVVAFAAGVFALVWASMLHFLIMGISWLVYRPLFGVLMLAGVGAGFAILNLGDGKAIAMAN